MRETLLLSSWFLSEIKRKSYFLILFIYFFLPIKPAGWIPRVDRMEGNRRRVLGWKQESDCQHRQTQSGTCNGANRQINNDATGLIAFPLKLDHQSMKVSGIPDLEDCPGSVSGGRLSPPATLPLMWKQSWLLKLLQPARSPVCLPVLLPSAEWWRCSTLTPKQTEQWGQTNCTLWQKPLQINKRQLGLHHCVNPRYLLKHLQTTTDDERPASWAVAEDA